MSDPSTQAANQALLLLGAVRTVVDPAQRVAILHQLHELLKAHSSILLPAIFPHALGLAVDPSPDLRIGILRLIEDTICRARVPDEHRMLVAARSVEALNFLSNDGNVDVLKRLIRCCTSIYPLVFKWMCKLPTDPSVSQGLATLKVRAFTLLAHVNDGVKESIIRLLHKFIMIQSPMGMNARAVGTDVMSLDICPPNHPFINVQEMNAEAIALLQRMLALLSTPGIAAGPITANINCLLVLARSRPQYVDQILSTLIQFTRTPTPHLTATQRRSVERTIKVTLFAILKMSGGSQYDTTLYDVLVQLGTKPYEFQRIGRKDLKRPLPSDETTPDAKRQRQDGIGTSATDWNSLILLMNAIGVERLPSVLVTELILQSLKTCSDANWDEGIKRFRDQVRIVNERQNGLPLQADIKKLEQHAEEVKAEPFDSAGTVPDASDVVPESAAPSELSDDEEQFAPGSEESVRALVLDITSREPAELSTQDRHQIVLESLKRIMKVEARLRTDAVPAQSGGSSTTSFDLDVGTRSLAAARAGWMLILSRLSTLVTNDVEASGDEGEQSQDFQVDAQLKEIVADSIIEDFQGRAELAITWLHHIWLQDERHATQASAASGSEGAYQKQYGRWLIRILEGVKDKLDPKDKIFARFLIDVPEVVDEVVTNIIKAYCDDAERMQLGLFTLQGLILHRPAVRTRSLDMLLAYALSPVKLTRATAIVMCKRFFSEHKAVGPRVEEFALYSMRRLLGPPPAPPLNADGAHASDEDQMEADTKAVDMKTGEENGKPPDAQSTAQSNGHVTHDAASDVVVPVKDEAELKSVEESKEWQEDDVVRHLELYFALCSKKHELLDELFHTFKDCPIAVQRAIIGHIQPLIKAMSSQPVHLLQLLHNFPSGSEALAVSIVQVLADREGLFEKALSAIKEINAKRDLDARFIIPVLSGFAKSEILQLLPKIVQLLDGTERRRQTTVDAFLRLVRSDTHKPAVLQPAELLVILHNVDEVVGLKRAVEATTICLKQQEVFKQEVMAVVLQQLADQTKLPTLFMRTAIQTATQFPGLVKFLMNLMLKLINKKIWTAPKIWEGFVRLCTVVFPSSLHVLQSLPKAPLEDSFRRSPKLRASVAAHLAALEPDERARRENQVLSNALSIRFEGVDRATSESVGSPSLSRQSTPPPASVKPEKA
ncbi:hypothetical protein HDU85_002377 [Gaertneriomyces sp. JEL0708]|nr:hypothetical protein HDU85_002377 [Gaertneriomyces sp. JEL0708]